MNPRGKGRPGYILSNKHWAQYPQVLAAKREQTRLRLLEEQKKRKLTIPQKLGIDPVIDDRKS